MTPNPKVLAAKWLAAQNLTPTGLDSAMADLYSDAYLVGARTAIDQLGGAVVQTDFAGAVADLDWAHWKPGHSAAATKVAADDTGSGLAALLDAADITVKGIEGTRLDQLANVLADGLSRGDSVATLAQAISEMIDDPGRAELIADTETARAMTAASLDTYRDSGVETFDVLLADDPCAVCEDAEADNPHDLGDDAPPYHPGCFCSTAPTLPDDSTVDTAGVDAVTGG